MLKIISTYTLTQYINKGQYGKVYKAIDHTTQQPVAIKMIPLQKFIQVSKLIELTRQQADILMRLEKNQNIIRLKEIIKSNRFMYMVYEYCEGGTLEEMVRRKGKLGEKEAVKVFRQLVAAYRSLYEHNIVHRDIKPDNIFFKGDKLKLADFGFCKKLKFSQDLTQTSLGSPLYMAPQVLNNDVYGSKADLWSCGIILYQLLFGVTPYGTFNINELLQQYSSKDEVPMPQQKRFISPVLLKMLKRMLCKDQFRRISWEEFFYEYEFRDNGEIRHREKDFQYDLMKLMKKNSSNKQEDQGKNDTQGSSCGRSNNNGTKFDWSRVTDMNSSVHSQDCTQQILSSPSSYLSSFNRTSLQPLLNSSSTQQQISSIYLLKKSIKHFESQHTKIFQLLTIIESLLQSDKQYEYDSRVAYFLMYNLEFLFKKNIEQVKKYQKENYQLLERMAEEKNKLQRLQRIFQKEYEANGFMINSIKMQLIGLEEQGTETQENDKNQINYTSQQSIGFQLLRYPRRKDLFRKVMKQYVERYELQVEGVLRIAKCTYYSNYGKGNQNNQSKTSGRPQQSEYNREQAIRLLKVLWGVQLLVNSQEEDSESSETFNSKKFAYSQTLSIKEETSESEISALLNRYLVQIGV